MAALSEVRHVVIGADNRPQTDIDVTVRIVAPNGYLIDGTTEVTDPAVFRTDDTGLVKMTVVRSSEYESADAVYEASWDRGRQKRYFRAPDVNPVNLRDVLTDPPSTGPGVIYTAGAAGRGIVGSPPYVDGVLQFSFSDGTTSTAAIPVGPQGEPGSGGPTGTSAAAGQPVVSSGAGGSASKFGRKRNDLVDRWGADPTGVVDASAALRSAIDASVAGDGPVTGAGTFLIASATRIVCPGKTYIYGEGSGATTFRFTHVDGGLDFGHLGLELNQPILNGGIRGITLDGNNTTRNLNYWGRISGWVIEDLELIKSGWDSANPDGSAALIMERAGNCDIRNLRVNNHQGHGIIADRGAGGHSWKRGRIGDCGKAGGNVHHFWARRTTPVGVTDVYDGYPNDWYLDNVFIEIANAGQTIINRLDAARNFHWRFATNGGLPAPAGLVILQIGALSKDNVFDGAAIAGSYDSGQDVSSFTLVKVLAGALGSTYFSGAPTKFHGAGIGITSANGPSVAFSVKPTWTNVATKLSGTTTRISLAYQDRYVENVPLVSGSDNRGVPTYRNASSPTVSDQFLVPNRGVGSASWVTTDLLADGFTPDWVGSRAYRKGQLVSFGGLTYRARGFVAATVVTFADANWEPQFGSFTLKYGTGWPAVRPVPASVPMTWIKTASAQVDPPSGLLSVGDIVYGPA